MDAHDDWIVRRAPARIDLAGGTVDIWPLCQLEPRAATVHLAIDRLATARVRLRDDGRFVLGAVDREVLEEHADRGSLEHSSALPLHREMARHLAPFGGIEIHTESEVPSGSGLGGSSTLMVAAVAAVAAARQIMLSSDELLTLVMNLEARVIAVPTGSQDYLAAIHGGLGVVRYPPRGPRRTRIEVDAEEMERRLVLVDTGKPHFSGTNNWAITKSYIDGDDNVRRHIRTLAEAACELATSLENGDFDGAADAINADWTARRQLAPGVTTPRIEELEACGREAGAQAVKVCGAGGGGCLFFWCSDHGKEAVEVALRDAGAAILEFQPASGGVA